MPQRPGGEVLVYDFRRAPHDPRDVDAAIMLVGERSSVEVPLAYARRGIPVALVAEGALDAPAFSEDEQSLANVSVVAGSSREALLDKLSRWLCSVVDKEIALAANFPFCRDVVVDGMVRRCALQNAGVTALRITKTAARRAAVLQKGGRLPGWSERAAGPHRSMKGTAPINWVRRHAGTSQHYRRSDVQVCAKSQIATQRKRL